VMCAGCVLKTRGGKQNSHRDTTFSSIRGTNPRTFFAR
jgi:hypothetical protein